MYQIFPLFSIICFDFADDIIKKKQGALSYTPMLVVGSTAGQGYDSSNKICISATDDNHVVSHLSIKYSGVRFNYVTPLIRLSFSRPIFLFCNHGNHAGLKNRI